MSRTFNYEGHTASGKPITGSIEADSQEQANEMLRQSGVFTREVTEDKINLVYRHPPKPRPQPKPKPKPEAVIPVDEAKAKEELDKVKAEAREKVSKKCMEEDPYKGWKDFLANALLHTEAAKKELKGFSSYIKGAGKTKKAKDASREKKVAEFEARIDRAGDIALGMAISEAWDVWPQNDTLDVES